MKPARKVVTRSPHRMVGKVCCPWLQPEPIEHESMLERLFIYVALAIPKLRRIRHQPFRIKIRGTHKDPDGEGSYVPDFLLEFDCGHHLVIEVKPAIFLKKWAARLEAASDALKAKGQSFFVVTDDNLGGLAGTEVAVLSRRHSRRACDQGHADAFLACAEQHPAGISLEEIYRVTATDALTAAWLVSHGKVWASAPFALDAHTLIKPLTSLEDRHVSLLVADWLGVAAR